MYTGYIHYLSHVQALRVITLKKLKVMLSSGVTEVHSSYVIAVPFILLRRDVKLFSGFEECLRLM